MSRPLRLEFPDALYHVTARGDRREVIFEDDDDRRAFLLTLAQVVKRFNWLCYAYCLMDNHYHLLIQTPDGNLSKGMRQLNGVFTQISNRRHQRLGHLFQGRFKAILVDSDAYLLELARYIVLNPVRAGMKKKPEGWPWSSYRASLGLVAADEFLAVDALLAQFAQRRSTAQTRYAQFVVEGIHAPSPWAGVKGQVFLGSDEFVKKMQKRMAKHQRGEVQIPVSQRRAPAKTLAQIEASAASRNEAIVLAHGTGAYSYQQIAEYFDIHFTTVGRVVRAVG
jgi:REP element-mobilizing transposase RayT